MLPKSCSFHLRKLSSSCIGIPISLCSYSSCKKLGYQHKFIVSNPYLQTSLLHHILLLLNYVPHQWTKIITGPPNSWHGHLNCGLIICMYVYHYMYTYGMIHTHRHTHIHKLMVCIQAHRHMVTHMHMSTYIAYIIPSPSPDIHTSTNIYVCYVCSITCIHMAWFTHTDIHIHIYIKLCYAFRHADIWLHICIWVHTLHT